MILLSKKIINTFIENVDRTIKNDVSSAEKMCPTKSYICIA